MEASDLIPVGDRPTPNELWALAYLFKPDWSEQPTTTTEFSSSFDYSKSAAEQRWGLLGRGRHTTKARLIATGKEQVSRLRLMLARAAMSRSLFPLASDQTELTANANSGATVLSCDTTNRRLFIGGRVVIARATAEPNVSQFEVRKVNGKTGTTLTLDAALTANFKTGDFIYPLIESLLIFSAKGSVLTDTVATVNVEAIERTGPTQLDSIVAPGTLPPGFPTYSGLPILIADEDFGGSISFGAESYGDHSAVGVGSLATVYGDRPSETFTLPVTAINRAAAFKIIGFFESRAGRLFPFYALSPLTDFTVVSASAGGVVIQASGEESDWSLRPFIGIVQADGTTDVRAITGVVRAAGQDTITFDADITGLVAGNIARCTTARLARFDADSIEEQWHTTNAMQTALAVRELTNEKAVTVANLGALLSSNLVASVGLHCGGTAVPTYYMAVDCDGNPTSVGLLNTGQTLPYEFYDIDLDQAFRIPVGALPTATEPAYIPSNIIQGIFCGIPTTYIKAIRCNGSAFKWVALSLITYFPFFLLGDDGLCYFVNEDNETVSASSSPSPLLESLEEQASCEECVPDNGVPCDDCGVTTDSVITCALPTATVTPVADPFWGYSADEAAFWLAFKAAYNAMSTTFTNTGPNAWTNRANFDTTGNASFPDKYRVCMIVGIESGSNPPYTGCIWTMNQQIESSTDGGATWSVVFNVLAGRFYQKNSCSEWQAVPNTGGKTFTLRLNWAGNSNPNANETFTDPYLMHIL